MAGKKGVGIGMAALAAGAGMAAVAAKNHKKAQAGAKKKEEARRQEYRNTERDKNQKNSKGIYYTNGNYEAFARPKKPEGVEEKMPIW